MNPTYGFTGQAAFVTGAPSGNAGIMPPPTDAADESAEQFDRVQGSNVRGIRASVKHELRHMREQGSGAIVNCSSLGGLVGNPCRAGQAIDRLGTADETAQAVLWLCSPGAGYVTGIALPVDGGHKAQ